MQHLWKKMADSSQPILSLILDCYHVNVRSTIGQETISISESAVSAELWFITFLKSPTVSRLTTNTDY